MKPSPAIDQMQPTRGGQMEGCATVVVGHGHVAAGQSHAAQRCDVTVVRREEKPHDVAALEVQVTRARVKPSRLDAAEGR